MLKKLSKKEAKAHKGGATTAPAPSSPPPPPPSCSTPGLAVGTICTTSSGKTAKITTARDD